MKKNLFALLKALCYTIGLHALLTVTISFLARTVQREPGQACLFLAVTLLLVLGICLFAAIPTDKRGVLWGCFGIAYGVGLLAAGVSLLFYGSTITAAWPGQGNLAWLLFLISWGNYRPALKMQPTVFALLIPKRARLTGASAARGRQACL